MIPKDSTPRLSFSCDAEPLPIALQALSGQVHEKLKCKGYLKHDTLVVSVRNCKVSDLLARIAKVEYGKWAIDGGIHYLISDPNALVMQEKSYYAKRALALEKVILEEIKAGTNAKFDFNRPITPEHPFLTSMLPAQVIQTLPISQLAEMEPGDRIVFSNHPTAMQSQMPKDCLTIVNRIAGQLAAKLPGSGLGKFDLAVQIPNGLLQSGIEANLTIYDVRGRIMGRMRRGFDSQLSPLSRDFDQFEKSKYVRPLGSEIPIQFTGTSAILFRIVSQQDDVNLKPSLRKAIDRQLVPYLTQPAKFDPLIMTGNLIAGAAKQFGENLVASLPDTILTTSLLDHTDFPSYEVKQLISDEQLAVSESNHWLEVSSSNPRYSRRVYAQRQTLQKIYQYALLNPQPSINALAYMAAKLHGRPPYFVGFSLIHFAFPWTIATDLSQWKPLELWGNLDQGQRNAIQQGRPVPFGSLSEGAKSVCEKMIYGAEPKIFVDKVPAGVDFQHSLNALMEIKSFKDGYYQTYSLMSEPTEAAPLGVPLNSWVSGIVRKIKSYQTQSKNAEFNQKRAFFESGAVWINSLAWDFLSKSGKPTGYWTNSKTLIKLKVYLGLNVYAGGVCSQNSAENNPPYTPISQLPADVIVRLHRVEKKIQKWLKKQNNQPLSPP